jgi:hypothetical protein
MERGGGDVAVRENVEVAILVLGTMLLGVVAGVYLAVGELPL